MHVHWQEVREKSELITEFDHEGVHYYYFKFKEEGEEIPWFAKDFVFSNPNFSDVPYTPLLENGVNFIADYDYVDTTIPRLSMQSGGDSIALDIAIEQSKNDLIEDRVNFDYATFRSLNTVDIHTSVNINGVDIDLGENEINTGDNIILDGINVITPGIDDNFDVSIKNSSINTTYEEIETHNFEYVDSDNIVVDFSDQETITKSIPIMYEYGVPTRF